MSDETYTVQPTIIKRQQTGGPYGLGNPDNYELRKVETDIVIPRRVREKSRKEKCAAEVAAFEECSKENGLVSFMKCRPEHRIMMNCLTEWFHNKEFHEECKQEYLKERSEYRRTGISKKQKEYMNAKKTQISST